MHIVAVILAAGLSRRMGTPKQLLPWGQTTLLGATIRQAQQARVSAVIVVSGRGGAVGMTVGFVAVLVVVTRTHAVPPALRRTMPLRPHLSVGPTPAAHP